MISRGGPHQLIIFWATFKKHLKLVNHHFFWNQRDISLNTSPQIYYHVLLCLSRSLSKRLHIRAKKPFSDNLFQVETRVLSMINLFSKILSLRLPDIIVLGFIVMFPLFGKSFDFYLHCIIQRLAAADLMEFNHLKYFRAPQKLYEPKKAQNNGKTRKWKEGRQVFVDLMFLLNNHAQEEINKSQEILTFSVCTNHHFS